MWRNVPAQFFSGSSRWWGAGGDGASKGGGVCIALARCHATPRLSPRHASLPPRACRWAKDVKDGMSAIEPVAYRDRFLAGMGHQLGLQQGPASTNRV